MGSLDSLRSLGRHQPACHPERAQRVEGSPAETTDKLPSEIRMLAADTMLGPYRIVAPIGAGGMGVVYRATDTRLAREVAVKVLSPHLTGDLDATKRFEQEARA